MHVRVGPKRSLRVVELMRSNCVMEKTLENLLDCKEVKPVDSKGNQSRIFLGRTDIETKALIWLPYVKSQLIGKDTDAKD